MAEPAWRKANMAIILMMKGACTEYMCNKPDLQYLVISYGLDLLTISLPPKWLL